MWKAEKEFLFKLKKVETEKLGIEFNRKRDFWDLNYNTSMVEEKHYPVQIRRYIHGRREALSCGSEDTSMVEEKHYPVDQKIHQW